VVVVLVQAVEADSDSDVEIDELAEES